MWIVFFIFMLGVYIQGLSSPSHLQDLSKKDSFWDIDIHGNTAYPLDLLNQHNIKVKSLQIPPDDIFAHIYKQLFFEKFPQTPYEEVQFLEIVRTNVNPRRRIMLASKSHFMLFKRDLKKVAQYQLANILRETLDHPVFISDIIIRKFTFATPPFNAAEEDFFSKHPSAPLAKAEAHYGTVNFKIIFSEEGLLVLNATDSKISESICMRLYLTTELSKNDKNPPSENKKNTQIAVPPTSSKITKPANTDPPQNTSGKKNTSPKVQDYKTYKKFRLFSYPRPKVIPQRVISEKDENGFSIIDLNAPRFSFMDIEPDITDRENAEALNDPNSLTSSRRKRSFHPDQKSNRGSLSTDSQISSLSSTTKSFSLKSHLKSNEGSLSSDSQISFLSSTTSSSFSLFSSFKQRFLSLSHQEKYSA